MLPDDLKQKLDADLASAAAEGDDALEQAAVGLAEDLNSKAKGTANAADAARLFAAARHVVEAARARLPESWRLGFFAGCVALSESMRVADRRDRLALLAEAEDLYRRVLEVQPDHLETLGNLGLLLRSRGDLELDRVARLQAYAEAERFYRRVLELQPDQLETLNNLGALLQSRGDLQPGQAGRLAAYAEAEGFYHHVLERQPNHVSVLCNLGALLMNRGDLEPDRAKRLQAYAEAERCYRRVLELQPDHLETLCNRGILLWTFSDLVDNRAERLAACGAAEQIFRRVLELQPDQPETLNNLAGVLQLRGNVHGGRVTRVMAFAEAEQLYRRVLELQPDQMETLASLGVLERTRARWEAGPNRLSLSWEDGIAARRRHLAEAATHSARALELDPTQVKAMSNLMDARLDALRLEDDNVAWSERAATTAKLLERRRSFSAVTTDAHFRNQLGEAAWPLGHLGAVCHLRAGDLPGAVAHLDANMAMSLAEALATPERRLIELQRMGGAEAADRFINARDALNARIQHRAAFQQSARSDTDNAEAARQAEIGALSQEIKALELELHGVIAAIRGIPDFDDFLRPGGDIRLIHAAAKDRPLVYLAASPWGGHALLVHGDTIDEVPLPMFDDHVVEEKLRECQLFYHSMLEKTSDNRLCDDIRFRLRHNIRFPQSTGSHGAAPPLSLAASSANSAVIVFNLVSRDLCRWLGKVVMQPVLAALHRLGADRAVLLPAGQLTYLPLHAAIVGGSEQRPELALERLQLSYAANARLALASATSLAEGPAGPPKVAALLDPTYGQKGPSRLAGCRAEQAVLEAHQAAGHICLSCHSGAEARVSPPAAAEGSYPVAHLNEATILHLGCHGASNHVDVFNSCLLLAPDFEGATEQRVPVSAILDNWPVDRLRLVVLSCCEGAMSGRQSFDELVSLQTAFAQGGAASVVGAMWAVRDDHTAALKSHFYDALLADPALDPAKALATAQARLLDTTPEAFPTIAAFQVLQG